MRLLATLWLLVGLFAPSAFAQPVLVAADMRESFSLNGAWHWSVDPLRDGIAGFHGGPPNPSTQRWQDRVQAEVQAANPRALFEFDMQRSPVTHLPGGWIGHAPEMRYYQGLVWYQRTFETPLPAPGKRVFLRFGAADYTADVWLNGQKVGTHKGGFTPFAFDVTKLLRAGSNQITVGVDSARTMDDVPGTITDWETYGGITRGIDLITTSDTYVDDAWVRLTRDGRIAVTAKLDGPAAAGQRVRVAIPALGFAIEGITDAEGRLEAVRAAPRGLKRWSPDSPTLYDVELSAGEDRLKDRIGFRTVEVRGTQILLNGKPLFLRGICMHEEELGKNPIRAITPGATRALLGEIKYGLHGNFVRLAHYPHNEITTRMADELGLLVWSEIPTYWRVNWENPETLATARRQLRENMLRDRNRASIVLWSVANETPINDARNGFLRTLIGDVRALDDSRLVTAALLSKKVDGVQTSDDPLVTDLDVMAINTYGGWYSDDSFAQVAAQQWRLPAKPLIFSEFGADTLAGYHDKAADPHKFSEEFQADYYRATLAMAAKVPQLAGLSPWILKDFRSPRRQHSVFQQGYNRKGLISETGERKLAFEVLAEEYRKRAAPK
ncbi:glycoside hydrolase family 2 TIM barrel-domain containing protein [Sphingomonas sp. HF-S4]|uniref:Glycoside hydrolase family 2 TIM barrel-domain containing protein n=1 Tax=Sphingomonas agrestis TaxID=3080540 RepID=A0ABU3Y919_9SPHN|nr:glycoside hydrolase family 2 TIM barrel-domain containing protein [Sphingomonas sp. HF-S4]MDV3457881.1 glycoside hydrolase family 2 TIM barrel-domain containing protein [Sphingomonas sp. HF-S4]